MLKLTYSVLSLQTEYLEEIVLDSIFDQFWPILGSMLGLMIWFVGSLRKTKTMKGIFLSWFSFALPGLFVLFTFVFNEKAHLGVSNSYQWDIVYGYLGWMIGYLIASIVGAVNASELKLEFYVIFATTLILIILDVWLFKNKVTINGKWSLFIFIILNYVAMCGSYAWICHRAIVKYIPN
jgi:hypothetical protein